MNTLMGKTMVLKILKLLLSKRGTEKVGVSWHDLAGCSGPLQIALVFHFLKISLWGTVNVRNGAIVVFLIYEKGHDKGCPSIREEVRKCRCLGMWVDVSTSPAVSQLASFRAPAFSYPLSHNRAMLEALLSCSHTYLPHSVSR